MGLLSDLAGKPRTGSTLVRGKALTVHGLSNGRIAGLIEAHPSLEPVFMDLTIKALRKSPREAVTAVIAAALDTTEEDVGQSRLTAHEEDVIVLEMLDVSFTAAPDEDAMPGEPEGAADADSPAPAPGPSSSPAADGSASIPSP